MPGKAILIFFLSILLGSPFLKAQDAQMEAKAAYELAEDAYSKANYKSALTFLQQVKTSLGTTNCKILFLEIMATQELLAKDTSRNAKLMALVTAFEKSPDYIDFNQEKKLEVTKLKLLLRSEQAVVQQALDSVKEARERRLRSRTTAHKQALIDNAQARGPFNITLDDLDNTNPKWKVKNWKVYKVSPTVDLYHNDVTEFDSASFPFPAIKKNAKHYLMAVCGVYVKEGRVIGYLEMLNNWELTVTGAESYYKSQLDIWGIIPKSLNEGYLLDPIVTTIPISGATATRYLFTEGKYGVMVEEMHASKGGGGMTKMMITRFFNPTDKETTTYHPSER